MKRCLVTSMFCHYFQSLLSRARTFCGKMGSVLPPLESGEFIASHAKHIKVLKEGAKKVAHMILEAVKDGSMKQVEFAAQEVHPKTGGKESVDWVFLMDTINFSFWPDNDMKYDVSHNGKRQTGYFAACAAVNKALERGIPVTDAKWMANATRDQIEEIFKSDSGHDIPLLEERVRWIRDSGRQLLEKWDGSFYNCVLACDRSAQKLLKIIVENFESFRDYAEFEGQKVSLLKRAQILVLDVFGALQGDPIADFTDIGTLTMFADYRVPQAMAYLGVLQYSDELLAKLKSKEHLSNGSPEEVELRGCSIAGCQRIVEAINKLREQPDYSECRQVHAADVDVFLWIYRRKNAIDVEEAVPFHRTRCIYY